MKSDSSDLREVNSISYTPEEVSAGGYLPMLRPLVEDPRFEMRIGGDGYCRDLEFVKAYPEASGEGAGLFSSVFRGFCFSSRKRRLNSLTRGKRRPKAQGACA